jgi:hypothetical protein
VDLLFSRRKAYKNDLLYSKRGGSLF